MSYSTNDFGLALVGEVSPEIKKALHPVYSLITRITKKQVRNRVTLLPIDQIINLLTADRLLTFRESLTRQGELWLLRLVIEPSKDGMSDKTWIKKLNIWYRCWETIKDEGVIGYKGIQESDSLHFWRISKQRHTLYPCKWFENSEMLLEGIGSGAQKALNAIVAAENRFDPDKWDLDGFYINY